MASNITSTTSTTQNLIVVDVSDKPATSKIVREGYDVPATKINKQTTENFIANVPVMKPKDVPRVVLQSVAAGTKVVKGTSVDLILAPPAITPVVIIEQPHQDLSQFYIADLTEGALTDTKMRQILLKSDKSENLSESDRQYVITKTQEQLSQSEITLTVDDEVPEQSFDALYNTMKGALAYK